MARKNRVAKENSKKQKGIIVEVSGNGATCIKAVARITQRTVEEVFSDALRIYLWVLYAQTSGKKVFAQYDTGNVANQEMKKLVENEKEAKRYFKKLNWPLASRKKV